MKILYINILYAPYLFGGAERTLQTLAEGMVECGHEVVVLTTGPNSGLHEDCINGVRVLRVGVRNLYWYQDCYKPNPMKRLLWHLIDIYNPLMRQVVSSVVCRLKPDVVSLHNLPGFSVSAWDAVWQERVPMVHVLHDQYLLCPRCTMFKDDQICKHQCFSCRTMRYFHPVLSNKVDAVVGISRFILDHHIQHGYFRDSAKKIIIYNARNNPNALTTPRRKPDDKLRFGFIGSLSKNKGIEILLRVFTDIARSNWELHVAGSGTADYEKFLHETYANTNIFFHGVQKPAVFYPSIDVLVVPSIWNEPLGVVVFEAMSYGVPVIGARRGGITEMIEEGKSGLLFEPDQPEQLKFAMNYIAINGDIRESISLVARDTSKYYLDTKRFVSSYEELYKELC